ncbi:tumor protein p73-like isoform X3 [Apostichopus japonicus]|uniref:tumor protein p73-like isoform X3 n=1 Tax=Stichopus japonicus TaxID=307972 RepID=UPI003AB1E958
MKRKCFLMYSVLILGSAIKGHSGNNLSSIASQRWSNCHPFKFKDPQLPTFPQPPNPTLTFPSVDSGLDQLSEMTTSPGAVSIQSPLPGPDPQHGAAIQQLPSNKIWPGDYEFEISLEACGEHAEKSISWTYSATLHKLYVDREKKCPINFKTSTKPPEGAIIRVIPIFKKVANITDVVKSCPHHIGPDGEPSANHIVICQDPATTYETDEVTGRHSLTLPYTEPQAGNNFVQHLFMFKCFISCVGGLNRRPIQLIFTLEHGGNVIGRQVLDTRICACPGRDRKADEKNKGGKPKKGTKRTKQITQTVEITSLRNKKPKTAESKDVHYYIRVDSKEKYEILMKIKEALDLMEHVTPEQKEAYNKKEAQLASLPPPLSSSVSGSSGCSTNPSSLHAQPAASLPQPMPPPALMTTNMHQQPIMMVQNCHQPSQNLQPSLGPPISDCATNFTELLGHLGTTSQPYDNTLPPISSSPSFTQLTNLPSLSRTDTLPILTNLSPSLQNYLGMDQPDGPQPMSQVSSSHVQRNGGPVASSMVTPTPSVQGNQVTSSMDKSIHTWLESRGFGKYSNVFQDKGLQTIESLEDLQVEFFNETGIPNEDREALWKCILECRTNLRLKCTPPLQSVRSNTSTLSNHSQGLNSQDRVVRATRYTLRQTLSFKVENTEHDET